MVCLRCRGEKDRAEKGKESPWSDVEGIVDLGGDPVLAGGLLKPFEQGGGACYRGKSWGSGDPVP